MTKAKSNAPKPQAAPVAPADTAPAPVAPAANEVITETGLETALEAFLAAAAEHVATSGSTATATVGSYRLRFNGEQLTSVTHV